MMTETTEEMDYEKMDLKEFGSHLIEMSKDLKYIGHEMKDSFRKPLDIYLKSARKKSDIENFCQKIGNLLVTACLNIDNNIKILKNKILKTEDNAVLQDVCTKLDKFVINSKFDRDYNLNTVESVDAREPEDPVVEQDARVANETDHPTTVGKIVYDDQLKKQAENERQQAVNKVTSTSQTGVQNPEILDVLEEPIREENGGEANLERNGGNGVETTVNQDLENIEIKSDSDDPKKADSFTVDIKDHELPTFISYKSDSESTIITSPTSIQALIDPQNDYLKYEKSTIPDNTSISEKLRDVDSFLDSSDSGRQSQNNSESEEIDIVDKKYNNQECSNLKKPINKLTRQNRTTDKLGDIEQTGNNEVGKLVCGKDTKENSVESTHNEDSDQLMVQLTNAISGNADTDGRPQNDSNSDLHFSDVSELDSSAASSEPLQNVDNISEISPTHHLEKELLVNLSTTDITPDKIALSQLLQNRETVKRKVLDDSQGIADDTYTENGSQAQSENGSENIDNGDQDSNQSFVFDLRGEYGNMASQINSYVSDDDTCETVCGSYSDESTDFDATLTSDINDKKDADEASNIKQISIPPRRLSSESLSKENSDDHHSDIFIHKKNLRKLECDTSDNEGDMENKRQDDDSEKDEYNDTEIILPRKRTRKLSSDSESKEHSEPSDEHSEIAYKIKKHPKKLESDTSDHDIVNEGDKDLENEFDVSEKPISDSKNNLPGSISDIENVECVIDGTELIKSNNTGKLRIELENIITETTTSQYDSNDADVGNSLPDSQNIDDFSSSDDDPFIEISPEEVLIDNREESSNSENDATKEVKNKSERMEEDSTQAGSNKISEEASEIDSLDVMLDELCEKSDEHDAFKKENLDDKSEGEAKSSDAIKTGSPKKSMSPQKVTEPISSYEGNDNTAIEKDKDDLLALLDERINENIELEKQRVENESEVNKIELLELLEERETVVKKSDDENVEIPQDPQVDNIDSDRNNSIAEKSSSSLYDVVREEELPVELTPVSPQIKGKQKSELKEAEDIYKKLLVDYSDVSDISDSELCDLNNLSKRKCGSSGKKPSRHKRRKKSTGSSCASAGSGHDTSNNGSDSDATNVTCDTDIMASLGVRPLSFSSTTLPIDEDELLADALCEKMSGASSGASSGGSDDENKDKKTVKKGSGEKVKKELLSKQELEKRAWRKDSLLHGDIDTDTDSDAGRTSHNTKLNEKLKAKFKKFKSKHKKTSGASDSDSDATDILSQDLRDLKNKNEIKTKENQSDKDASDTESEIEFVAVPRTPQKNRSVINISDDDVFEETTPTKGKGRRNIRALVSDENLAESTQKAQAEENERIARLKERKKIKESLTQSFGSLIGAGDEDCLVLDMDKDLNPLIQVHSKITSRLKPHQKEGVQFMWESCYESLEQLKKGSQGSGCILAHCMGLGKTLQALALIHTIFSYEVTKTKHVLVVCPLSTVPNWKNEYKLAYGSIKKCKIPLHIIYANKSCTGKYEVVRQWYKKGGMLVLGYEAFGNLTDHSKLDKYFRLFKDDILEALVDPGPDLVICDEGHLLRNKGSRRTLSLNKIKTKRRIVLTGTPLQNNLLEYYHMVNFVKPNLLGTEREYKTNFVNPITNGQYEDSTAEDIKLMKYRTHILHRKLKKTVQRVEDTELKIYLPSLTDYGVFIQLHKLQVEFYRKYLEIALSRIEGNKKTFLSDVQILKYVGSHPHVLKAAEKLSNKKIKEEDVIDENDKEKVDEALMSNKGWWKSLMPDDASEVIEYGNKFQVVMSLIEECENIGDKMLIFSQNYAEMDSLEHFLKIKSPSKWRKKTDYYRMDGTVPPEERTVMCDNFNNKKNKKLRLFIMSTKVGGLGLNLTGANRVIIMNVNWNPSYDTQSVFRTFRFGQEKEVFVYRLISMDTMEEKIYQRQVTKLAIAHRVVDKHQITRHYNSTDILELYTVAPNADIERSVPNLPTDTVLAKVLQKHAFVFRWHEHQQLLANRPEEDLNEAEKNAAWEEFNRKANEPPPMIHPHLPFGVNVPATQRPASFAMASTLANFAAHVAPTANAFLPGTHPSNSSVINVHSLPNSMKINSVQGLDSPSSEDHDYCLPKPSPFSSQGKSAMPFSTQHPAKLDSKIVPTTPVRKLIFSHNTNTNLPNPVNAQFNKNVPPLLQNNSLSPVARSVLVSSSNGQVTISPPTNTATLPVPPKSYVNSPTYMSRGRPPKFALPSTITSFTKPANTVNTSTLNTNVASMNRPNLLAQGLYPAQTNVNRVVMPPLIRYPKNTNSDLTKVPVLPSKTVNPNSKPSIQTDKSSKEPDPLYIEPNLVGSNTPMTMSYEEAVTLAEKLNSARRMKGAREVKAADPPRKEFQIQKMIQKKSPKKLNKFKIHPEVVVSEIQQKMTNNISNIMNSKNSSNTHPAVTDARKANPTTRNKQDRPINANGAFRRPPVDVEMSKVPAGLAKKSNKENNKVPVSHVNLVDDDIISINSDSTRPNTAPLSNDIVRNLKHMKEISINKVQKEKNAKNVIKPD